MRIPRSTTRLFVLLLSVLWLPQLAAQDQPNFIIIVPDDHRWDATGFMQERMSGLGRIARYPWFVGQTPGMDRLSEEGIHFDNAFVPYSLCSPSRATMLTGVHAHLHGIVDNATYFPTDTVTYATLLRDAGYQTGYFGKWHMSDQVDRPGFATVATFRNQGNYFGNTFYVNGAQVWEDEWVDDVSTDYMLDFVDAQALAGQPFLAFLGFKTPHDPRIPPAAYAELFSSVSPIGVPNMSLDPPFRPGANSGTGIGDNRNYFECLVGIDDNVVRVLNRLDSLGITENTVVIYISDNGYFQGEHGLGDKRAAYEESIRIPFMIRYPALQQGNRIAPQIVLNLDIAPTILDLAGVPVPAFMQGRSLAPLIAGGDPADWRRSFFFSYARDPAFPTAIPALVSLWKDNGEKLVHYPYSGAWTELFNVQSDPYETVNLAATPGGAETLARLYRELSEQAAAAGFLRMEALRFSDGGLEMDIQAGSGYNFRIESSNDLQTWLPSTPFKGTGDVATVSLVPGGTGSGSFTVEASTADYALTEGPDVQAVSVASGTLRVGANSNNPAGGRNAVLVFPLPFIGAGSNVSSAELQVTAWRLNAAFNGDLWAIGIKDDTSPILRYLESADGDPEGVKLQSAFLDTSLGSGNQAVVSSPASGLTDYLRDFYAANPGYSGGRYLFLRLNPDTDPGVADIYYTVYTADISTESWQPVLRITTVEGSAQPGESNSEFYRAAFADPGSP